MARRSTAGSKPGTADSASPSPPPVSVPLPEARPKTPIPMVAVPIQTTVTATQGIDVIELEDDLAELELQPDDVLRIGVSTDGRKPLPTRVTALQLDLM